MILARPSTHPGALPAAAPARPLSRWEPFKALFEAQYLPLLLLALPQSYNVFRWLDTDPSTATLMFAIVGGLAFEAAYVGTIAWADRQAKGKWFWLTALMALAFSIAVAVRVHLAVEGWWSVLHAGFPAVAFAYTMIMHNAAPPQDFAGLSQQLADKAQAVADRDAQLATLRSQAAADAANLAAARSAFAGQSQRDADRDAQIAALAQKLAAEEQTVAALRAELAAPAQADALTIARLAKYAQQGGASWAKIAGWTGTSESTLRSRVAKLED